MSQKQDSTFLLTGESRASWSLNTKAKGEVRPLSIMVTNIATFEARSPSLKTSFEIINGLFNHQGKFYLVGCTPEGRSFRVILTGKRYICRLDNFPFSNMEQVDQETMQRLRTFRGRVVGEFEGAGSKGHRVTVSEELEEIALPLAASCYLFFSSA